MAAIPKKGSGNDEVGAAPSQGQQSPIASSKATGVEAPCGEHGPGKRKSKAERKAEQKAVRESKKAAKLPSKEPATDKKQKMALEGGKNDFVQNSWDDFYGCLIIIN
jgi:hypothetical protein